MDEPFEVELEIEAELNYEGPTLDSLRIMLEAYYQHMYRLNTLYEQSDIENPCIAVRYRQAAELVKLASQ